jgi:hypothetical protein
MVSNRKSAQNKISINLEIPIYKTVLNILIAKDVYSALKIIGCHKEMEREYWDSANAVFNISPNGHWSLAFAAKKITPGTIAHECLHATFAILESKGIKYNRKSEEAFTYLLDYLVDEVTKIIEEHNG